MAEKPGVRIEGLKELQREVRRAKDSELKKELRIANKEAAQPVVDLSKVLVPKRSGRLAASVRNASTVKAAIVKAGTPGRVPYAGPIHFGWPRRNIKPQPFMYRALDRRIGEVRNAYERAMQRLGKNIST